MDYNFGYIKAQLQGITDDVTEIKGNVKDIAVCFQRQQREIDHVMARTAVIEKSREEETDTKSKYLDRGWAVVLIVVSIVASNLVTLLLRHWYP